MTIDDTLLRAGMPLNWYTRQVAEILPIDKYDYADDWRYCHRHTLGDFELAVYSEHNSHTETTEYTVYYRRISNDSLPGGEIPYVVCALLYKEGYVTPEQIWAMGPKEAKQFIRDVLVTEEAKLIFADKLEPTWFVPPRKGQWYSTEWLRGVLTECQMNPLSILRQIHPETNWDRRVERSTVITGGTHTVGDVIGSWQHRDGWINAIALSNGQFIQGTWYRAKK